MSDAASARLDLLRAARPDALPIEVVDVGANPITGDPPYLALLRAGDVRVLGFEPQPDALARLMAAKSERETYLPMALGAGEVETLHICANSGFTSIFPPHEANARLLGFQRGMRVREKVQVQTARLDDLSEVGRIDFFKIDVQGAELSIIANGRQRLSTAVLVQTELRFLPIYQGEPSLGELDAELRLQGFQLYDFAFLKHAALRSGSGRLLRRRQHRQLVDGDAFYIRDLTAIDQTDAAQVLRLAILAEGVMNDPALVLFCLDALVRRGAVRPDIVPDYVALLPANSIRAA
ncbi:hypothetical protein CCR83_07445 [Rhodobacter veldkampii DSM 11550]|uniref:FkbM family methyltransferase n=1 Tax=Phaeovulum veldkampii DSM 11550 TaxID=1185920 RepID=A0A2T4JGL5_9RHOB|nr:FkbM family methyltransferase [Phaeovulum veldkampii]MBK5946273.1 hypothetical protein [Phaeovulum veldkampii DSM 11550]PTE16927.1 FkbM family methyltransferase [Phaeovulum veldkampii DSM 11550]TDQ56467.1 FkbM family methyltransferase [Phaeovulum veldkampii DSM 11550]